MTPSKTEEHNPRQSLLLGGGAILGLLAAIFSMIQIDSPDRRLPEDVVASIDGYEIPMSRFEDLLADLETDSSEILDESDRQFVINRLIDEELLILHGIDLGMPRSDAAVRKAIAATLLGYVANQVESIEVDETELEKFYENHASYFSQSQLMEVSWYRGDHVEDQQRRFLAFHQAENNEGKRAALLLAGLEPVEELPIGLMTFSKARDYMGSSLAEQAFDLRAGQWSAPVESDGQVHVLFAGAQQQGNIPPFEDIRDLVEAEFRRRQGDAALREYLGDLRRDRDIYINEDVLQSP